VNTDIAAIHQFWFGPLDPAGKAAPAQERLWFGGGAEFDAAVTGRFGGLVRRALAGEFDHWAGDDAGLIALVLLLDQFTRNIFRATPRAFAGDSMALAAAQQALAEGRQLALPAIHRVFLYLPLEHCEDLAVQEQSVRLFTELAGSTGAAGVSDFLRYAVAHRDVIARFGRFPHRNTVLGRTSSPEELAYMETHGGF
jgi:uncharacterized protein (DUF924 family)